ncbi:MAG: hypothetical protein PHP45_03510 [Elusimicrobiales bacterium]|nr:hypothetical protein [Elusimicrobiales bacterium]
MAAHLLSAPSCPECGHALATRTHCDADGSSNTSVYCHNVYCARGRREHPCAASLDHAAEIKRGGLYPWLSKKVLTKGANRLK